eukprot:m.116564 g.116564  ORF g.116564 m.116564 type:complete len:50 (-) comp28515_c2_seq3:397-546(-)
MWSGTAFAIDAKNEFNAMNRKRQLVLTTTTIVESTCNTKDVLSATAHGR